MDYYTWDKLLIEWNENLRLFCYISTFQAGKLLVKEICDKLLIVWLELRWEIKVKFHKCNQGTLITPS